MKTGDRVQLHPASNWWARGARFGVIAKLTPGHAWVLLDATARVVRVRIADILEVVQ
jgi:hypothetical protein